MANVIMPKIKKRTENLWSLEDLHRFLKIKRDRTLQTLCRALFTSEKGLRKGELYASKMGDLDFDNNLLTINKQVKYR